MSLPPAEPIPYGSVRIQYSGVHGSVIVEVSSVEHSKDLVVDAKIQNEGNGWAGSGANPWHLDNETESLVFLTDMSDKPARIGFKVWAEGTVYYVTKLRLLPHETRVIDIRKLRDAQQPDVKGNKIPAGAADGSVLWVRGDNVPVMGRVAVIDRHGGVASAYDCCDCVCALPWGSMTIQTWDGSAASVQVGSRLELYAYVWTANCNGDPYAEDYSYSCTWYAQNTSIATVASGGNVTGVAGGSTYVYADTIGEVCTEYWPAGYGQCNCINQGQGEASTTVTVLPPAKIVPYDYGSCNHNGQSGLQTITDGSVVDCGGVTHATKFCGVNNNEVYRLVDSTGAAFQAAYTWQEAFSNYSTTNKALTEPIAKSANVPAGGYLTDAQFAGFTYPTCLGSNDHLSYTQTSTVTVNGKQFPLSTVVSISLGHFSGTPEDNVTITTP